MVRLRDKPRARKGRFIHSTNNTLENIFGTSQTPLINLAQRYSRSNTCRGEIAPSQELNELTSTETMELG